MRKLFFYLFSLFFILLVIGFFYFLNFIKYNKLVVDKSIDSIAILTGGKGRITLGLKLFKKHPDIKLIISGVDKKISIKSFLPSKLHENNKIYIDQLSESTFENALVITDWLKKNKLYNVYVITSYYHMPRSMLLLNNLTQEVNFYAYPVKREKSKNSNFLPNIKYTLFLMQEYIKYLLSLIILMLY